MRALILLLPLALHAAPGMWPLDRMPTAALQALKLQPDAQRLMRATVRLPNGTGSFVSNRGLVLTNHHVVSDCIAALSSAREPLLQRGFVARRLQDERRCPGMEVEVLQGIDTRADEGPVDTGTRQQQLERWVGAECPAAERCELIRLYGGALIQRYRYRVFDDVRLAFAPEAQAANFGGDDDNFNYPRHAFDFALLRVHAAGQPLRPTQWLRAAHTPPREGDAVMVTGHPYSTRRLLTVAQLEAERDALLPAQLAQQQAELDALRAYAARSAEAARESADAIATLENSLKARRGELRALRDPSLLHAKRELEQRVRAATPNANPWQAAAASAEASARLAQQDAAQRLPAGSLLDQLIRLLVQREESRLPATERLPDHAPEAERALRTLAAAPLPLHPQREAAQLRAHWAHAKQTLGADSAWVRAWEGVLPTTPAPAGQRDGRSESQLEDPIEGRLAGWLRLTRLQQAPERLRLLDQPLPADEPLLQLANALAPLRRALLREQEQQVRQPLIQASEAIARARWQVLGPHEAPDATFTLRLSFGRVAEVSAAGLRHPWQTTFGGLFARSDGFDAKPPFDLPPRLRAARGGLDPRAPLNFIATADIVGGNSGSPVLNAAGEWVGVAFDGNLDSLAGSYHFDEASNRMIVLHQRAMQLALRQVYGAAHLARELGL